MSLGMPVVGTAMGSNLEIIEDGKNGFLAETENDWYDKIKILLESPGLGENLGKEARQTVLERFDIEKQIDFLEKEFRQLKEKGTCNK